MDTFLQIPHPLGFNDNIYHDDNISRFLILMFFSLLDIRKRKKQSHCVCNNRNLKRKI